MNSIFDFIPVSAAELEDRGLWYYDFLIVSGDAYVDNPAFDAALYARMLEAEGFRTAILAQPGTRSAADFTAMGRPRLGVIVSSGRMDSMLANYTVTGKRRPGDPNSPGGRSGLRPDHAAVVYSSRAREAFPGVPVILCGPEASLRRFAHYDYRDGRVRGSVLVDSGADMLVFGTGESSLLEIARRLKKKLPVSSMTDIRGTAYITADSSCCAFDALDIPSFEDVRSSRRYFADAVRAQLEEYDHVMGRALIQEHDGRYVIVNPPALPISTAELDRLCELPFTRSAHPMYSELGGVPAADARRFAIIAARGCEDRRSFSPAPFHQSTVRTYRSAASILREAERLAAMPGFNGCIELGDRCEDYVYPGCSAAADLVMPLDPDKEPAEHAAFIRRLKGIKGVKKITVNGELPCGYLNESSSDALIMELLSAGRPELAPLHCAPAVLDYMGLPPVEVYEQTAALISRLAGERSRSTAIPFVISAHPGCTLADSIAFACYMNQKGLQPAQVFDFFPLPGTVASCMYYSEIDPRSMKRVEVERETADRDKQHVVLQWKRPDMRRDVTAVLRSAGRSDLIGFADGCLLKPSFDHKPSASKGEAAAEVPAATAKPASKKGWAKAKPKKNARPVTGRKGKA